MILTTDTDLRVVVSAVFALLAVFALALAGCAPSPAPSSPAAVQSAVTAMPSATATSANPSPVPTSIGPVSEAITLTIWGPESFAPSETTAGGQVLQAQYQAFANENPAIGVQYVRKVAYGQAGLQRSLLLANYAAPSVLPDVAIVDAFELEPLVRAGLAQPLQDLVGAELRADLFPFAREAGTFGDDFIGVQFDADIEHLIYYTEGSAAPPANWGELFSGSITYIFPAAGENGLVNDAFLIQYFDQEGQLVDEEGKPALDESAIRQVLRLYDAGIDYEVVPTTVLDLADLEDCWEAYIEGNITVSHISSWRYLNSLDRLENTTFAALPTAAGQAATMSRGWAFVVITPDLQRQEAAAKFIEWLIGPQNLAEWSRATGHLPARRSAVELAGWPQSYTDFLETQLEVAFYRPSTPEFERIAQALQAAVEDVLSGELKPRAAASLVISSLE